jgi:type IV pilus assembly protein PilQ
MFDPRNGWLGVGISVAAATCVAVLGLGCASPTTPSGEGSGQMVQTMGGVSVSREGGESVVRLEGLIDPIYSVTTSEEDNLVVVDLVGVDEPVAMDAVGEVSEDGHQIAAYDGVVDLVTVTTFADEEAETALTRVEIVMAGPGMPEVDSTGDALEIRIMLVGEGDAEDMAGMSDDWEGEEALDSWSNEEPMSDEGSESFAVAEMTPPPAATRLTQIAVETTESGVLVGLEADGAVGALEAFTLADPARLVIDLPGVSEGEVPAQVSVDSEQVTAIRVGGHADKVRVVIDGGSQAGEFEGRQIMPGTTGLWVAIGSGDDLGVAMNDAIAASEAAWASSFAPTPSMDETMATASTSEEVATDMAAMSITDEVAMEETEEMAIVDEQPAGSEMVPEATLSDEVLTYDGELTTVYGLHYERKDGLDRVAILSEDSLTFETVETDPTTVVVRIPGASISEEASDRIFPDAGGPISLIHAFQQPEVEVPEVRVVFTRAPDLEPVVTRRGSMLFVEFQDMGVAAAPPPAFPPVGNVAESMPSDSQTGSTVAMTPQAETLSTVPSETPAAIDPMATSETPAAPTAMVGGEDLEMVAALPSFDTGSEMGAAEEWSAPETMAAAAAAPPAAVEVPAAIEVLEEGGLIDGKEYRGRRISLDFKNVAISDVLRLIAEVSDLNIIAGDEVAGNVTIRLVEVPWDQALDVILMTKGLGFVRVGNVLRIAPSDVLKAEEEVRLQERRNKEKLEDLEVKLLPVNYAAVKDIEGLVKRLLSPRGTVNLDKRTNTLIIKDISSVIDEASALVAAIDTQTPQVMIEAKIVEAALGFSRELGANWAIQSQQWEDPFDPGTPRRDLGSEDFRFIDDNNLVFANPITSVPTAVGSLGALILDEDIRIDVQIQAAESQGDGKVISSPRIVTLDNKEAKIEQGVSIPFQTFEGGDAKLEFIDAVLSLNVTPHVTADESIIMKIEVTRDAPDDSVQTPTGSPAIAKNQAETETLVKDGQTLVLGGIYTIEKSQRQSRVPYLHRLPVIGNAFKSNEVTDARKELLVFVTPRIVRLPEMASN